MLIHQIRLLSQLRDAPEAVIRSILGYTPDFNINPVRPPHPKTMARCLPERSVIRSLNIVVRYTSPTQMLVCRAGVNFSLFKLAVGLVKLSSI